MFVLVSEISAIEAYFLRDQVHMKHYLYIMLEVGAVTKLNSIIAMSLSNKKAYSVALTRADVSIRISFERYMSVSFSCFALEV